MLSALQDHGPVDHDRQGSEALSSLKRPPKAILESSIFNGQFSIFNFQFDFFAVKHSPARSQLVAITVMWVLAALTIGVLLFIILFPKAILFLPRLIMPKFV
jgi:hypothetical protein